MPPIAPPLLDEPSENGLPPRLITIILHRGAIVSALSPADIKDMISSYASKVDFEIASLHLKPHTFDAALTEQSMRLFAREVMPRLE